MDPHEAIRLSKQGQLHPREMLEHLVAGKVTVPVLDIPVIENARVTAWQPVSLSKPDGSRWITAFTTKELASAYCDENQIQTYLDVDTRWVLFALPEAHGIVFDLGSETMFQWNAAGIAKYIQDVLR